MRDIKFRAWDKSQNAWVVPYNGLPVDVWPKGTLPAFHINLRREWILSQFTGLLDKQGKEIYEGDIVEWFDNMEIRVVKREIKFKVYPFAGFFVWHPLREHLIGEDMNMKIIGNIWEHPELLKEVRDDKNSI